MVNMLGLDEFLPAFPTILPKSLLVYIINVSLCYNPVVCSCKIHLLRWSRYLSHENLTWTFEISSEHFCSDRTIRELMY